MSAFEQLIAKGAQQATLAHFRGLSNPGLKPEAIAEAFELPLEKENEYIKTITQNL